MSFTSCQWPIGWVCDKTHLFFHNARIRTVLNRCLDLHIFDTDPSFVSTAKYIDIQK